MPCHVWLLLNYSKAAGANIRDLADWMGHESVTTTEIYFRKRGAQLEAELAQAEDERRQQTA